MAAYHCRVYLQICFDRSVLIPGQRGQLTQETELLDSLIQKVENQVAHSSKAELICRSEELLAIFKQVVDAEE